MKTRIASTVAVAAAIVLGATGCSLVAPIATATPYGPSDGVNVDVGAVDVRNIMLVADESGDNFNVVFGAVNQSGETQDLTITFTGSGSQQASAEFEVPTGNTLFGDPEGEQTPVLVTLDGLKAGSTIEAYFQIAGSPEVPYQVPVLDGTLEEYRQYVLPENFSADENGDSTVGDEITEADEVADQPKVGDDVTEEDASGEANAAE
ncbi:DNA modification methylase [Leucobacter sp. USCH14]|uniref:DNA modification methylase n=1 Tax=Leucobacter sp. USCH14 TaxID=3024838 RepID=UPI0030AAA7E5